MAFFHYYSISFNIFTVKPPSVVIPVLLKYIGLPMSLNHESTKAKKINIKTNSTSEHCKGALESLFCFLNLQKQKKTPLFNICPLVIKKQNKTDKKQTTKIPRKRMLDWKAINTKKIILQHPPQKMIGSPCFMGKNKEKSFIFKCSFSPKSSCASTTFLFTASKFTIYESKSHRLVFKSASHSVTH